MWGWGQVGGGGGASVARSSRTGRVLVSCPDVVGRPCKPFLISAYEVAILFCLYGPPLCIWGGDECGALQLSKVDDSHHLFASIVRERQGKYW